LTGARPDQFIILLAKKQRSEIPFDLEELKPFDPKKIGPIFYFSPVKMSGTGVLVKLSIPRSTNPSLGI
jgi:hypothetical protein